MNAWYLKDKRYQELNGRASAVLSEIVQLELSPTGCADFVSREKSIGSMRVLQSEYDQLSALLLPYFQEIHRTPATVSANDSDLVQLALPLS